MRQPIKRLIIAAVVVSGSLISPAEAACLNDAVRTIPGEFHNSLYVVLATPVSTVPLPESPDGYFLAGDEIKIRITKVFKGRPAKFLEVFSEHSSGGFPLKLNMSYILFLSQEDGRLGADNCGHSGLVKNSRSVLDAVQAISTQALAHP